MKEKKKKEKERRRVGTFLVGTCTHMYNEVQSDAWIPRDDPAIPVSVYI